MYKVIEIQGPWRYGYDSRLRALPRPGAGSRHAGGECQRHSADAMGPRRRRMAAVGSFQGSAQVFSEV